MTAQIHMLFVEIRRFLWFFIFFFSKKLDIKKLIKFEIPNHIVRCYWYTFEGWQSSVQVWLLKSLCFSSRLAFFFFKNVRDKKLTEFEFLNPIVRCYWDTRKSCKSSVQVGLLKSSWFSRWYGVFYEFFTFFFKKLR